MIFISGFRGGSCTVRRCVEKSTCKEYAVKIIDLTGDKDNEIHVEEIKQSTAKEIQILQHCAEHEHISE